MGLSSSDGKLQNVWRIDDEKYALNCTEWLNCKEIAELLRICREEMERARQLRTGELYAQKKEKPSTVNQLLSQIQELQDKVNALHEEKEFHDQETASSSGMSHVPNQTSRIPSPRGMLSRDSWLPHHTWNSMGTSGNVFFWKSTCSRKDISVTTWNCHETGRRSETRTSEFNNTDSKMYQESWYLESHASYWRNLFSKLYDGSSEVCYLGIACREILRSGWLSVLESTSSPKCAKAHLLLNSPCRGSMKWRWLDQWTILWRRNQLKGKEISLILRCLMRGLRLRWEESSLIPLSEEEAVSKRSELKNTTDSWKGSK